MNKRPTHAEALLRMLGDGHEHHMRECLDVGGFRYGGRLHDLRKQGYIIETRRIADGEFAYRLLPREPKQLTFI